MVSLKYRGVHKKYIRAQEAYLKMQDRFNRARLEALCDNCSIGKNNKKKRIDDWCDECKANNSCKDVIKIHEKMMSLKKDYIITRDIYAEKIYNNLSKHEVEIVNVKTNTVCKFVDVFQKEFSKLSPEENDLLVALIEEDGGLYRIKQR